MSSWTPTHHVLIRLKDEVKAGCVQHWLGREMVLEGGHQTVKWPQQAR